MRWLLSLVLLSACTRALDTPLDQVSCETFTDAPTCLAAGCAVGALCARGVAGPRFPGCHSSHGVTSCTACATVACDDLTDPVACTDRPDCYALFTFDEPCNSAGCESHFSSCIEGPPTCNAPPVSGGGDCLADETETTDAADRPIGCVAISKCPGV